MRISNKGALIGGISALLALISVASSFAAGSIVPPLAKNAFFAWGATKAAQGSNAGAPATPVMTITTTAPGAKWYSQGCGDQIIAPVTKGEKLTATFYIKAVSPSTVQTDYGFQKGSAPYTTSVTYKITATKSWKKIVVPFKSVDNYAPGQAGSVFHTGYAKYSFEIAGLTLVPSK